MLSDIAPPPVCHPTWDPEYWIHFAVAHLLIGIAYFPCFGIIFRRDKKRDGEPYCTNDVLLLLFVESCGIGHFAMALNLWAGLWYVENWWHTITVCASWLFVWHAWTRGPRRQAG